MVNIKQFYFFLLKIKPVQLPFRYVNWRPLTFFFNSGGDLVNNTFTFEPCFIIVSFVIENFKNPPKKWKKISKIVLL